MYWRADRDAEALISQALDLVRGRPFDCTDLWWLEPALLENIRATVTDAAQILAEWQLEQGRSADAARTLRKGLLVDPAAEHLRRLLMQAAHDSGNIPAVHEAWDRLLRELAAYGLDPHPDASKLYHRLTSRQSTPPN